MTAPLIGIVATPSDRDLALTTAQALTSSDWACALEPATIDLAPIVIVIWSASATQDFVMDGLVERAFTRRARLLPVLIDVDDPPDHLFHFLAALKALHCSRAELVTAIDTLQPSIRHAWARAVPQANLEPVPLSGERQARSVAVVTWSHITRSAAGVNLAVSMARGMRDVAAVLGLLFNNDPTAFQSWVQFTQRTATIQSWSSLIAFATFIGWFGATWRMLVLAGRETHVVSWRQAWLRLVLATFAPAKFVRLVSRAWEYVASGQSESIRRHLVYLAVLMWSSLAARIICSFYLVDFYVGLGLGRTPSTDPAAQTRILLAAASDSLLSIAIAAIVLITAGYPRRKSLTADLDPARRVGLTVAVMVSAADRGAFDVVASALGNAGIRLHVAAPSSAVRNHDALIVFGRAQTSWGESELSSLTRALQWGTPIFPVAWGSVPPIQLQSLLGPLNWHFVGIDSESMQGLLHACLSVPTRSDAPRPSQPPYRVVENPTRALWMLRLAAGAFAVACTVALFRVAQTISDFDLANALLYLQGQLAVGMTPDEVCAAGLENLLAWSRTLLPVATFGAGLVWMLTKVHRLAGPQPGSTSGPSWSAIGWSHGSAQLIIIAFGLLHAAAVLGWATMIATASGVLSVALILGLCQSMTSTRNAVRRALQAWGAAPARIESTQPTRGYSTYAAAAATTVGMGLAASMAFAAFLTAGRGVLQANAATDQQAAIAAVVKSSGDAATVLFVFSYLPFVAIWFAWTRRCVRASTGGNVTGHALLAAAPVTSAVVLPDMVATMTTGRDRRSARQERAARMVAAAVSVLSTLSLLWLLQYALSSEALLMVRKVICSALALLAAALLSVPLYWLAARRATATRPPVET